MPEELLEQNIDPKAEKKKLNEEKKRIKAEQKQQKKEVKQRAKEIAIQESEMDEDKGGGVSVFVVTLFIVVIWIAILCLLIKLDVGGFGSGVLTPVLKDVPVINKILPSGSTIAITDEEVESYGGFSSLQEAVDYIRELELELERAQSVSADSSGDVEKLEAEVERLREFEQMQVEFQRITTEFYEEVVYAENAPDIENYQKYYESIDPTTAEYLYKQVIQQIQETEEIQNYAQAYSEMKPKGAAAIFESMTDNLDLVARILSVMEPDERGKILEVMDSEVAARLTKIMDPES